MTLSNSMRDYNTPILFTIYNRPDVTKRVFEAISQVKPPKLYIAADGPRPHISGDFSKCNETRSIIAQVDWPCEVMTLYQERNLGCGVALSTALSWFFTHEERGIVLEDDCLPSKSFFGYCQELLERYQDDKRVMHIGGNNFLNGHSRPHPYSYYFSRNGHVWGWATWRRAWRLYDFRMGHYFFLRRKGYFDHFFSNPIEKLYRLRKLDQVVAGTIDTWDYQWDFARFINSGLAIVPRINLVRNIGAGLNATHTKGVEDKYLGMERNEISLPLEHPPYVLVDTEADDKFFSVLIRDKVLSKFAKAYKKLEGYSIALNGK